MSISRTSMPFQISKPPERRNNGEEKVKKRRVLPKGKGSVQGLAQRLRFGGSVQVPKSRGRKLGKLY